MSDQILSIKDAPDFLTVEETALLIRRHVSTVYRRLERGEWPFAWKEGNDWRIEKSALLDHLRHAPIHTRKPATDPMPQPSRARFEQLLETEMRRVA
jgi:excisionase family DNA binding protein